MKIVKSTELKADLMRYCLIEKSHAAVVTEGPNNADVVSMSREMLIFEFEIKVSRSDLKKELDCIEFVRREKAGEDINSEQMSLLYKNARDKRRKHKEYNDPKEWLRKKKSRELNDWLYGFGKIPNYFYFVVTPELAEYCLSRLEGSSFGVITAGCRSKYNQAYRHKECNDRCYNEIVVVRRPRRLHNEKANENWLVEVMTRMSWENKSMLDELIACKRIVNKRHEENKDDAY